MTIEPVETIQPLAWHGDEIVVTGTYMASDIRHGSHRLADLCIISMDPSDRRSRIGRLILAVEPSESGANIRHLVSINISERHRNQGWGAKVVELVRAASDGPIRICDISPKAIDFWKRQGCIDFVQDGRLIEAILPDRDHAPTLAL